MPDLPIVMLGCGAVARVHAMAIAEHGDARLAAVVGPELPEARAFSRKHGGYPTFDDLDILRGNWGQAVTPGDKLLGDPSGDGFVGGADLDLVRKYWN